MKIVTDKEFNKLEPGTVWCPVRNGSLDFDGLSVITSTIEIGMTGVMPLKPDIEDGKAEWCTVDDATYNYNEGTMFAVFEREDIDTMIRILNLSFMQDGD